MRRTERKENKETNIPSLCDRRIWKFYEWGVVLAPIFLMLSHWYIFWVFSQNNYELLHYSEANTVCIGWIYFILYLYVPLMLLPASYFFRWCNIFRIPFAYLLCINIERLYYGDWFCTNEMIDTHYFLIFCTMFAYIVEIIRLVIKYKQNLPKYLGRASFYIASKCKEIFGKNTLRDPKYDKIIKILEERGHAKV